MAHNFGTLVFTPLIKALQEKYGSRRQYARMETGVPTPDRLGPDESAFIRERDSFWPTDHIDGNAWLHTAGPPLPPTRTRESAFPCYTCRGWQWTFPAAPAGALPATSPR
jgi:hypothetical protein